MMHVDLVPFSTWQWQRLISKTLKQDGLRSVLSENDEKPHAVGTAFVGGKLFRCMLAAEYNERRSPGVPHDGNFHSMHAARFVGRFCDRNYWR